MIRKTTRGRVAADVREGLRSSRDRYPASSSGWHEEIGPMRPHRKRGPALTPIENPVGHMSLRSLLNFPRFRRSSLTRRHWDRHPVGNATVLRIHPDGLSLALIRPGDGYRGISGGTVYLRPRYCAAAEMRPSSAASSGPQSPRNSARQSGLPAHVWCWKVQHYIRQFYETKCRQTIFTKGASSV
jgi:hypothetical protein